VFDADPHGPGEHIAHLFDEPESRVSAVSSYLCRGVARGAVLLVVACPEHWLPVSTRMRADGCQVDDLIARGRLVVLDAASTLAVLMDRGRPSPDRFEVQVSALMRRLWTVSGDVWAYGELVDLLAARGEYQAAQHLEAQWNQLHETMPFTLLCGYASVHFGDPRTAATLRSICAAHSRATAASGDLLGSWLLSDRDPSLRAARLAGI
jgi:hypothetical protein